jgi:hypothetical protein
MIDNQNDTLSVGIRKFDGLTASAPLEAECGLAVDVNHIPKVSIGNVIAPIECPVNDTFDITIALIMACYPYLFDNDILLESVQILYCLHLLI